MQGQSLVKHSLSPKIGEPYKERKVATVRGKLRVWRNGIAGIEVENGPLGDGGVWEFFELALQVGLHSPQIMNGEVDCVLTLAWNE